MVTTISEDLRGVWFSSCSTPLNGSNFPNVSTGSRGSNCSNGSTLSTKFSLRWSSRDRHYCTNRFKWLESLYGLNGFHRIGKLCSVFGWTPSWGFLWGLSFQGRLGSAISSHILLWNLWQSIDFDPENIEPEPLSFFPPKAFVRWIRHCKIDDAQRTSAYLLREYSSRRSSESLDFLYRWIVWIDFCSIPILFCKLSEYWMRGFDLLKAVSQTELVNFRYVREDTILDSRRQVDS